MSTHGNKNLPSFSGSPSGKRDDDYVIGYGKPPVEWQFRKGQSGNPRGRPKGARNKKPSLDSERLLDIVQEEARRTIQVRDGGQLVDMSMAQAVVRTLAVNAAKGNTRAQKLFTEMLKAAEQLQREQREEFVEIAIAYKLNAENVIRECEARGCRPPEIYPHPRDILIDFETGDVLIVGPMCAEEVPAWDKARRIVRGGHAEACRLRAAAGPDDDTAVLDEFIATVEERFAHLLRYREDDS